MSTQGRPNYFDTFQPNRVTQGEAISRTEMIRRLAHYVQVPQRFGYRLMLSFEEVMYDALQHGEGVKFKGIGTITIDRHKKDTYTGLGVTANRKVLYKFTFKPSADGKKFLAHISNLEREGQLSDHFSNPNNK